MGNRRGGGNDIGTTVQQLEQTQPGFIIKLHESLESICDLSITPMMQILVDGMGENGNYPDTQMPRFFCVCIWDLIFFGENGNYSDTETSRSTTTLLKHN